MPTATQPGATLFLNVTGMSCAACQTHIENALRETPGVTTASVNLLAHTASVTTTASPETIIEVIREAGYDATIPTQSTQDDPPETTLKIRAITALIAAAAAMFVPMLLPVPNWLLLLLTLAIMAAAAGPIYRGAYKAALHRTTNMNTLVTLGTGAALLYSAFITLAPTNAQHLGLPGGVYYEAVLFILAFLLTGKWLESRARRRALSAIRGFAVLQPNSASVLRDGIESTLPLDQLHPGDICIVRPGERIPVDGVITRGETSIDQSLLTGESLPVFKAIGDTITGGAINLDGSIELRATTLGADSMLAQMLRLIQQAQSGKAPMQQLADKVSSIFVPAVIAIAFVTFAVWFLAEPTGAGAARAIGMAITVLVIACPCALGLAVPAALTVAIGRAAQLGVLIKGADSLERLARINAIALDKTGTLTLGKPRITAVHLAPNSAFDEPTCLRLAAAVENRSTHPVAQALVDYTLKQQITIPEVSNLQTHPGKGVTGTVENHTIAIGNAALFTQLNLPQPAANSTGTDLGIAAGTDLHLAIDGAYAATFTAEDTIRPTAAASIAALHKANITTWLLTGDNPTTAAAIARESNIPPENIRAALLPADKAAFIRHQQKQGASIAMAGDGINDAAALAQSDAGFAMGAGTEMARDAGSFIVLGSEIAAIPQVHSLARRTLALCRQNIAWALAYNIIGIPIAAGALYPAFGIRLSPILASAAMAFSSISVLLNSLRLRHFNPTR